MSGKGQLSLREAYEKWADELVRFATVLVGPGDAADVVADAFVGLLDDERSWGDVDRPRSYLFGVVANRSKMRHRAVGRRRRREERYERIAAPVGGSGEPIVADAHRLLDGLSPQQRAVVYLAYWEDWTAADIAGQLGVSDGTVRQQLARARAKLREELS